MEYETLLTIDEAAERLQISRRALYAAIARGALTPVVVGGRQKFRPADLAAYRPNGYKQKRSRARKRRGNAFSPPAQRSDVPIAAPMRCLVTHVIEHPVEKREEDTDCRPLRWGRYHGRYITW